MDVEREFTLQEVLDLGFEAYHVAAGGVWWLLHDRCAIRSDAAPGTRTLVTELDQVPRGPWQATAWGKRELAETETR